MKTAIRFCLLLAGGLVMVSLAGCSSEVEKSAWEPVWEVPPSVYSCAMGKEMENGAVQLKRAKTPEGFEGKYDGVIPRVFKNAEGRYRICWIKKDPLRASYWYDMYEFSADGMQMKSAMSSIPSSLTEPDHTKIPGW